MSYTGTEIFNQAIAILDELSDTGIIVESQIKEYKHRAPYLLDLWQHEMARLENIETIEKITELSQEIPISEQNCPSGAYYLAEHFAMADQNDSLAAMCREKFLRLKSEARKPLEATDIADAYNVNAKLGR